MAPVRSMRCWLHIDPMGYRCLVVVAWIIPAAAWAQVPDTTRVLDTLTIEAYQSNRSPLDMAASVGLVRLSDSKRFSEASLVPTFNMLPGVRMEERSPGSYRFSIRGSLIRSPFGVRNVKFYYNGLPFTDGGGNTYVNLLDATMMSRAEVIKGPAGSLYGAGTGGVVLLRTSSSSESGLGLSSQFGPYASVRYGGFAEAVSETLDSRILYMHQESGGYREQSAMKRNGFIADLGFKIDASTLVRVVTLYSDLFYQTPGGLTESQFQSNPQQARPPSGSIPGAVEQQAAVYNKTLFSGISLDHQWNPSWSTTLGIVGSDTDFRNPSIRNYETRKEQNLGVRLSNSYERGTPSGRMKFTFGGEYQRFATPVTVTNNQGGLPGTTVLTDDDIRSQMALGFAQWESDFPRGFQLTVGASVNYVEYTDDRRVPTPETAARKFNPVVLPRIAVLKRVSTQFSAYLSASRGYSPPTVAEVVPSTGIYNPALDPESGWSYEAGITGRLSAVDFHLAVYDFRLHDAIVLQRDSSGADFFVNAGGVNQQGIELNATWEKRLASFVQNIRLTSSLTYNSYHFDQYVYDGNDYSGNPVTGVAPWIIVVGVDAAMINRLYCRITANYTDRTPLNDANTDFASAYFLIGGRVGMNLPGKIPVDVYVGIDNALNQRYSLGNDLNAVGKRYFNAAPPANFYFGLSARLNFRESLP